MSERDGRSFSSSKKMERWRDGEMERWRDGEMEHSTTPALLAVG
jgi:hypothetical protein